MGGQLEITYWGVRGSLPVSDPGKIRYGGSTSCVEIKADNGTRLVFDGGSGISSLGNACMQSGLPEPLPVFITHPHWDHIQGLPFFAPAFIPGNAITFYGCNQGEMPFENVLRQQMQSPYFPVDLENWAADIAFEAVSETEVNINGLTVRSTYVEHPGMTLGFRIEYGEKSVVYIPDNEPFAKFPLEKVFSEQGAPGDELDMESVFLLDQKEKFFGFIGDADVLIHDAQYTPEEYPAKTGWGHSSFELTVQTALYGNVRQLVLFHHDPIRTDDEIDDMVDRSRHIAAEQGSSMQISAARQNTSTTI